MRLLPCKLCRLYTLTPLSTRLWISELNYRKFLHVGTQYGVWEFTIPRSCKIECSLNEMLAIRDLKTNNNRLTNWEKQFCNYDNWFQMVTFSCHFSYLSSWAHNCRSIYKTWTEFCFWLDNEILKISWRYILLTPSTFGWKLTRIKMDKVPFVFKIVLLEIKF